MIGLLSSVQRDTLSSHAVADAAAGATTLLLADAKPFDVNGGTVKLGDGTLLAYATVDQDAGTMTLAAPLAAAVPTDTPVVQMTGEGEAESWTAWVTVDPTSSETLPASIPLALVQFFREGTVQAGTPVEYGVGLSGTYEATTRPDQPGVQDVRNAIVDEDGTTVPDAIAAAASSGGDGTPTTAPDSSPTPDAYQDSGAVAVRWDVPADPRTHVRMFLALAVTNSDGTGSIDTSVSPVAGNLYADDVQPIQKVSTLTLGGDALDPKLHYQVALGAWNSVGDAPPSAWVLCQPAFIAPAVITDTLIAERINAQGIAIASSQAGSYPQPFSGTSLPTGWTQTRTTSSGAATGTSLIATVENSSVPTGTDGSALKFDPRTYGAGSEGFAYAAVYSDYTVGDFDLLARFQYSAAAGFDSGSRFSIGSRSTNTSAGDGLTERGIWVTFTPGDDRFTVYTGTDDSNGRVVLASNPVDPGNSFLPDTWYWTRLTAIRGVVKAKTWRDGQTEPTSTTIAASSSQITSGRTFARGLAFPIRNGKPRPTFWVDSVSVTAYTTGFLVTPDGGGDWAQVLDPIRTKNTQQDGRLTTNESNIAANTTATQTNASAITALGTRVTSLEQWAAVQAQSTAAVSPTDTTNLTVTGASVSFTVGATAEQWALEVAADVSITAAGTTNTVEGLIDGGTVNGLAVNTRGAATTRTTGTKRIYVTGLSVGSHTLTARTRNTAPSTGATVNAGATVTAQRTA